MQRECVRPYTARGVERAHIQVKRLRLYNITNLSYYTMTICSICFVPFVFNLANFSKLPFQHICGYCDCDLHFKPLLSFTSDTQVMTASLFRSLASNNNYILPLTSPTL